MTITVTNYIDAIDEEGKIHHVTKGKYKIDEEGNFLDNPEIAHLQITEQALKEARDDGSIEEGTAEGV